MIESTTFTQLSVDEKQEIGGMQQWLLKNGAHFQGLRVVNFSAGYRGVIATRPIAKKQRIVFIPKSQLITLQMARESPVCAELLTSKAELLSPKHTLLAIFLLEEAAKGEQSQWHHYISILPRDHRTFPINYTNEELTELIGSSLLMQIHEKVFDLKKDYDRVLAACPQKFSKYRFRDFCWARTMVASRMFGVMIDGVKTNILAPFADMLNHRLPKQTVWNYLQTEGGFAIQSLTDIPQGIEVCDSYGRKCNSRYLLNYGFVLEDNTQNQICLKACFEGPLKEKKLEMIRKSDCTKILKVSRNLNDNNFFESMGFLRFRAIAELTQLAVLEKISGIRVTNEPYLPAKTPPITMQLEIAVWRALAQLCQDNLKDFATSLQEDERRLREQKLSDNMRNILIVRSGEKKLNEFFVETSREVIGVLEKGYVRAFEEVVGNQEKPYAAYLFKILSIMPHQRKKEVAHLTMPETTVDQDEEEEELQSN